MRCSLLFCLVFGVVGLDAAGQSLPTSSFSLCGDRRVELNEQCDDGNTISGDGCDAACGKELILKLPEKARRRALIGTLVSYPVLVLSSAQLRGTDASGAISVLGLTTGLAPSLGHFYTKAYGRGAATSAARYLLNAGASVTIAFFSAINEISPLDPETAAGALVLTSLFLLPSIGFSVWDIQDAPLSIQRMARRGKYK